MTGDRFPRIGFVEWPDGLIPASTEWQDIAQQVRAGAPDILITNELPFGPWVAGSEGFSSAAAQDSIAMHETGIAVLHELGLPAIITSRPVAAGGKLANEAVILTGGSMHPLHRKRYLPDEPGWHECAWFEPGRHAPAPADVAGISIGALLCTELMFNEHARCLGRAGAALIAVPRATGLDLASWETAASMAALVGGCYVVSSNRRGRTFPDGVEFGGHGFAFAPGGKRIAATSRERMLVVIDLDPERVANAKKGYPCYVSDVA